jgi:tRNA(His) guanylyltransferase
VVRVDGRGFTRFCDAHGFAKPNDPRGLALMNAAAAHVMREWGDVVLAYGVSDEYSFILPRDTRIFGRRSAKIATCVCSAFAAAYVLHWPRFFAGVRLAAVPSFDARCVAYPSLANIVDYVKWRLVDSHINCLYNECFWALVSRGGMTTAGAHEALRGTVSEHKHELLFAKFGINYAKLPAMYRRGTTLVRQRKGLPVPPSDEPGGGSGDGSIGGSSRSTVASAESVGGTLPAAAARAGAGARADDDHAVPAAPSAGAAASLLSSPAAAGSGGVAASSAAPPAAAAAGSGGADAVSAAAPTLPLPLSLPRTAEAEAGELRRLMQLVDLPPSVCVSHSDLLRGTFLADFFGALESSS